MIKPLHVAAYGTLLTGMGNWRWALADAIVLAERDRVRGYFMRTHTGYPAVFEGSPDSEVVVDVFDLSDLPDAERRFGSIDSMEFGAGYVRRLVRTVGGRECWLYVMPPDQAYRFPTPVASGDWRTHVETAENQHD